ncbi:helix-turn-helix domain-containing protein [Aurantimonas endophytica]|uniref:AraC family transcriptional activator of pyochelin receptor n=1 Tax=Aurantimonas endophytica TaxID=1522175 RepID=A0A7W6HGC7_9HYPH|nr:AraC family transcriptional activator of pyochelin receptor [Aurantimonas endophytica]MCO6405549.1 helix-turn-helix domain-containing protein [Aurantimonas endophytica]
MTAPIGDGLRIVVMLAGAMRLRADDARPLDCRGPTSLAILSDGEADRDQLFHEGERFRAVLIQIDPSLVAAETGVDPAGLLRDSQGRAETRRLVLNARPSDPASHAVAAQIFACPTGKRHDLYRLSKALELTALVLGGFEADRSLTRPGRLTAWEAERIRLARDLLLASLSDAPNMALLASSAGMNPWKLSRGFRLLYGMTPYALLQEERLQAAFRLLVSAQWSVGRAAAETGYSQTHFATLFRKRFGLSPRELLPKGSYSEAQAAPSKRPNFSRM